jgi:hypothetical protein
MKEKTVRELGGEIWAEVGMHALRGNRKLARIDKDFEGFQAALDVMMGVIARHVGKVIKNDIDLPVKALPRLRLPQRRAKRAIVKNSR